MPDHETRPRLGAQPHQPVLRITPKNEADAALFQSHGDITESLHQEGIVPKIGVARTQHELKKTTTGFV